MKFSAKGGGRDFKRVPSGNHIAVLNIIADVGLQPGSAMYPEPKHQVYLRWEIPAERVTYEKAGESMEGPMCIGRFYTASMSAKANLRKDVENWRAKALTDDEAEEFELRNLLGKSCMITVQEVERGGKTYSNVKSVGALPKGMPAPKAENPLVFYEPGGDISELPERLREKIQSQIESKTKEDVDVSGMSQYEALHDDKFDDDIPF